MDCVLVEWFDAFDMPYVWAALDEIPKDAALVKSVGWLLDPSPVDGYLTLATSKVDDVFGGGIHIPVACVVNVKKLKIK